LLDLKNFPCFRLQLAKKIVTGGRVEKFGFHLCNMQCRNILHRTRENKWNPWEL